MTAAPILGPTRVQFSNISVGVGGTATGAWYPYTLRLADELPGVLVAAQQLFGEVSGIAVNWHNFRRLPGLDSPDSPMTPPLMTLTTKPTTITLLVIPPRTASSLAAILLRQASNRSSPAGQIHSLEYQRAERILDRAGLSTPTMQGASGPQRS